MTQRAFKPHTRLMPSESELRLANTKMRARLADFALVYPNDVAGLAKLGGWFVRKGSQTGPKTEDFTEFELQLLSDKLATYDLSSEVVQAAVARRTADEAAVAVEEPKPPMEEETPPEREPTPELKPLATYLTGDGDPLDTLTALFNHKDSHVEVMGHFSNIFKDRKVTKKSYYDHVLVQDRTMGKRYDRVAQSFLRLGWRHLSSKHMKLLVAYLELDLDTTLTEARALTQDNIDRIEAWKAKNGVK